MVFSSSNKKNVVNALLVVAVVVLAMYFKFFLRRFFLFIGYPKLEPVHPTLGKYEVGALKVRLDGDVVACQMFYPTSPIGKSPTYNTIKQQKSWVPYYRAPAVTGVLKFLGGGAPDGMIQMLQEANHPNHYGADVVESKGNFPLVFFSHGLGGGMEMYSQLCSQMASLGTIVVAVEHADTSASYAEIATTGKPLWYTPPDYSKGGPYSRAKMISYRGPHLEQRVDELSDLYDTISKQQQEQQQWLIIPKSSFELDLAVKILSMVDATNLHLVGHSFGGSTVLLAAQRWAENKEAKPVPRSMSILDTWNFALSDEIIAKGIPAATTADAKQMPLLSMLSQEWAKGFDETNPQQHPELEQLLEFLRNSQESCHIDSYYAKNSMHQSFSDTQAWSPLAKLFESRGKNEDMHVTIRAAVAAFASKQLGGDSMNNNSDEKQQFTSNDPVLAPFAIDEK